MDRDDLEGALGRAGERAPETDGSVWFLGEEGDVSQTSAVRGHQSDLAGPLAKWTGALSINSGAADPWEKEWELSRVTMGTVPGRQRLKQGVRLHLRGK